MAASLNLNRVCIGGKVSDAGVVLRYAENGTPEAQWTVIIEESGAQSTSTFKLFVVCCAFGKAAETITEQLDPGDVILIPDGKLKWRSWSTKSGEKKTRLEVSCWSVQVVEKADALAGAAAE